VHLPEGLICFVKTIELEEVDIVHKKHPGRAKSNKSKNLDASRKGNAQMHMVIWQVDLDQHRIVVSVKHFCGVG